MSDGMQAAPSGRFGLAGPHVMVQDYGDEVVVANLETGLFYSIVGAHREVWNALHAGHDVAQITAASAEPADVDAVRAVVDEVVRFGAEAAVFVGASGTGADPAVIAATTGMIETFDDLQDALLLDPIHDVGDEGWPSAAGG